MMVAGLGMNVTGAAHHDGPFGPFGVDSPHLLAAPEFLIPQANGPPAIFRRNRSRTSISDRRFEAQIYGDSLEHGWADMERPDPARLE